MRLSRFGLLVAASLVVIGTGPTRAAVRYPLTLTLNAQLTAGPTTVTSKVTIQVARVMDDAVRTRVTDALLHGGYLNFVTALSHLPPLGSVETQSAKVQVRYVREEQDGTTSRLVLVADSPLFFLSKDPSKSKTGYKLTVVDLRLDDKGGVTGQMAGAARVKPAAGDSVQLDDYAEALVQLTGTLGKP